MTLLECKYCGATAEADSFKEADALIDHSLGLYKSNGCPGDGKDLLWDGHPAYEVQYVSKIGNNNSAAASAATKKTIVAKKTSSSSSA